MHFVLSVDVMSGDHGLKVTIPACIKYLKDNENVNLILVGDAKQIYSHLANNINQFINRIEVINATEVVEMNDSPHLALRNKKDSSMRVAIEQVKNNKADCVVSAGNTGALMAISRYLLRTIDGIDRPAIAKILPTINGEVCVLDLGANIKSNPQQLLQFGIMGSHLIKAVSNKLNPTIGLLNVGTEDIKGDEVIKEACELLKQSNLNFYGYVEGDDITKGTVDVIVCDGFTGNVALKTIEGVAKMISLILKQSFSNSVISKIMAMIVFPILNKIKHKLDPRKYNGAILLGLNGVVIKSHGSADSLAFYYALDQAKHEVSGGVIKLLSDYIQQNQLAGTNI